MVAYLGQVNTAIASGGLSNAVLQGLIDARVKVMVDTYTILGTELSGSTITLGKTLPNGSNILFFILYVSAAQTSLTASLGDGNSATRYGSALTSLQTAGTYFIGGKNYEVGTSTSDGVIKITTGGATATTGTLKYVAVYTLD